MALRKQQQHEEVELGFAEKCERKVLISSLFFPSKLGGKPAWLNWNFLPSKDCLTCCSCSKQMIFLCQIYVPVELSDKKSYHRTLYIFCCRNGPCSSKKHFIKAFRSQQLEQPHDFNEESKTDAELQVKLSALEKTTTLCSLCGCFGDKSCSSCHEVSYCCKDHQVIDWKSNHKSICSSGDAHHVVKNSKKATTILFDEYEIVIEPEPTTHETKISVEKEQEKFDEYLNKNPEGSLDKQLEKDLKNFSNKKVDEQFLKFKECIELEAEQILRYQLGGEPLWVSDENIPIEKDIPHCTCGAKRQFEFQILPQMINYLGVETTMESIDWGVICIYTCVDNCMEGETYKEEFIWKQDFSSVDVIS